MPSPHILYLDDYEYYDALGRDPLQQNNVWSISDPSEQVGRLEEILQEYPKQKHRRQMLFKAASRGDEAIVRFLVETGLKVHPVIGNGPSEEEGGATSEDEGSIPDKDDPSVAPLHTAAQNGRLDCVKILLRDVNVNVRDEIGRTPLIAAAQGANTDTVKYLLENGADPTVHMDAKSEDLKNSIGEYAGADALEIAAVQRNIEAVQLLLEHPLYRVTRNRRYRAGREPGVWVTPLAIKSAAHADFETLQLLLECGAYPMGDEDGKTKGELLDEKERQAIVDATAIAAELGDLESLKLLLSYQYATDEDGRLLPFEVPEIFHKPFIYGAYHAMRCNKPEKFEFLRSFGLKEHSEMSLDKLPEGQLLNIQHLLDQAVENGSIDCVRLLVEKYNANPNQHRFPSGIQPLYAAASNNNGRFATGSTALWIAIHLKSLDCVAHLLRYGGPVDHVDEELSAVSKPTTAILMCFREERAPVRLEIEENAREYIENFRKDFQELNPPYVRLELGRDDRDWIRNLQRRSADEQLREEGEGARELNEREKVKNKDLHDTDPRRHMGGYPTNQERENELNQDDDLLPLCTPAFVPVAHDDDDR
ncbi:hypothetical protein MMC26_007601 [Xylographa opegraphella]|nr:hypothetical protein [Xylographa opegraphella]